ncbi:MAG: DUF4294 domain-containing protein [Gelidibacter sp.]|nr:DUF4294 domain-containing protein [Gelidibacter sp.]
MKFTVYIVLLFPFLMLGQIEPIIKDSTAVEYYVIDGDSVAIPVIELREVVINKNKNFDKEARISYLILKRKTLKVYPYAKLAAERLVTLNERLATLEKKSDKRAYAKIIHKYLEEEFAAELKKLTRTEGQILVKLIHRQTGKTTFQLIKELRSGWRAFWFNNTARLFDISLKKEFEPATESEDFLIEDILQKAFRSGQLVPQEPAFAIDYQKLREQWTGKTTVLN